MRSLFHRQLQLPQAAAAELLAEYEAWEASTGNVSGQAATTEPNVGQQHWGCSQPLHAG